MTVSLKRSKDCDCVCHKGGVVVHVVPCCEEYVPDQSKPKHEPKSEKTDARSDSLRGAEFSIEAMRYAL